ncbi:spermidine/putrescine ABC transporter substrate-binding protein PotF [Pseudomonas lundensis]|uniref:Spermidine/putrescine ABC transporter substrate-binding protein PotF n=1 Tax=Pseudomonas lundensis TaxID=86185 RepID=A0ABX4GSH5_9PSED|nr:polyamine ABC transporter substrate-binding protein [Pseudomonas lundensis]NMZ54381.1 polyamine ABC transporter substrate-binding protein [Pseudomonas lundensis]OZY29601.1 spermidine/putrescine ABC transporter substrate-binding protein PotF [Pseudomonas lundensis]OZY57022.1 spermidine/putrescine ABC transporter substrate-binding protein PotF [Pseudomonas lundensis]QOF92689.1 polyamine ABC transporter substrate-binding protein [Pseudomonas lundensis]
MNALKCVLNATVCGLALMAGSAQADERELRVYNWADYILPSVPKDFAKQTGIKVTWDTFDTNESLEAKLLTGHSGYDLVVPSNQFLDTQIKAGVFQKLDRSKLPNWQHQDPELLKLLDQNDPGNQYAIPYMYGTVLIGFNPAKVKAALGDDAPVDSWDLVFKPENMEKLKSCGVVMLDSASEILPLALHYLGLDPNSQNPADYEKAKALMMKIRPYVTYFNSAKYMTDIANGDICVAIGYSGSFYQFGNRAKEAGNGVVVDWRLPKEGAPIWFDTFAIPKSAKNVDEAHAFLNTLLDPNVIAPISDFLGYPNANKDALALINQDITGNPNLTPTPQALKTLYVVQPLPQKLERVRTRVWTSIKSDK